MSENDKPTEQEQKAILAESGKAYPIRMMHFMDGTLIVGFVISVQPDHIMMLHPYELRANVSEDEEGDENIAQYQLTPYMDQLIENDPETLVPVPFMVSATVSPAIIPSAHVRQFYMTHVQLKIRESMIARGVKITRPTTLH